MIKRTCKTCKHLRKDCDGTSEQCLSWRASRSSLWAEIGRLEAELERARRNGRAR